MDGWSLVPLGAGIPERVIVYGPVLGGYAHTVMALVFSMLLLGAAVRYRRQLRRRWRRGRRRPQWRPAHA